MIGIVASPRSCTTPSASNCALRTCLAITLFMLLASVPLATQAQTRAGFWETAIATACDFSGGDWLGTRCARDGGAAANLVPAMINVDTRDGTAILAVDAVETSAPGLLSVEFGQRSVSFRTFTASALATQLYRMNEPGFSARVAYVYRTIADDPRYLGLYYADGVPGFVLGARADTTPIHGFAVPLAPGRDCRSFPSCMRVPERHEQWYRGYKGNEHFPPQANPGWTHEPLPAACSPFAPEYVPPFLVDGLVFGELRNDLMYLSEANIAALAQIGYDFEALLVQDFGPDWQLNSAILAVDPAARRKARVDPGAPGLANAARRGKVRVRPALKTEAYYADLIANRLIVANPVYTGSQCQPLTAGQAPSS